MIDPSMDALVNYLMKMRGEDVNPMMPPRDPMAMLMQSIPQQSQNPLSNLLASAQQARPTPGMLGFGMANQAATLLELQKLAKEAALSGDFDAADAYAKKIQELQTNKDGESDGEK